MLGVGSWASPKSCPGVVVNSGLFLPAGLTVNDIDIFEINEAFASQVSLGLSVARGPEQHGGLLRGTGWAVALPAALAPSRPCTAWRS